MPFVRDAVGVTDNLDGRGVVPVLDTEVVVFRCGMREGVCSSIRMHFFKLLNIIIVVKQNIVYLYYPMIK